MRSGGRKTLRVVAPYASAAAAIAILGALLFAIRFTYLDLPWVAFLSGVLTAAVVSLAARTSHAEWLLARRTVKLSSVQDKLARETLLRQRADKQIAATRDLMNLVDDALPVMIAYADAEQRCRYHNRAYRQWLGLSPEKVDGRTLRELLGAKAHMDIVPTVRRVLAGRPAIIDRTHRTRSGAIYHLAEQYLPHFAEGGQVCGFYTLLTDITEHGDIRLPAEAGPPADAGAGQRSEARIAPAAATAEQDLFIHSLSEQVTGHTDAASGIVAAIENDAFRLFCQRIAPLAVDSGESPHCEILVRLMEEEENLMPPGAFFPLIEKYGLMPHLDRWVVRHVLEWASCRRAQDSRASEIFFVNVALATISDPEFPRYVRDQCERHAVPGGTLCFEMTESEVAPEAAAEFARQVKKCGSRIALGGFGRNRISFDMLRCLQANFVKIDGSIILDILRDPVDLARVKAIIRVAKAIGVRTIAEFVEDERIAAKVREIGVDFAQGFGISQPLPLAQN